MDPSSSLLLPHRERPTAPPREGVALLGVLLAIAIAGICFRIGVPPLIDPDEGRNAEVSREMAQGGDYVVPHLDGVPYLDKPVAFFAFAAASIRLLGPTSLAPRVPSLLFTLATIGLTLWFGARIFGIRTGLLAAVALGSCPIVVVFARTVIFDSGMLWWITLALVAFYMSWERPGDAWPLIGWAAVGFGALTKGPVALALTALVVLCFGILSGRPLRRFFDPRGPLVFAAVTLPWFLLVSLRLPEFPYYAFVVETFMRLCTDDMRRAGPVWYFLPVLFAGGFPWVLALLAGLRGDLSGAWRERRSSSAPVLFLLCWIVAPLVFFSFSQSKLPGYILPVFPAVALLAAHLLTRVPGVRRPAAVTCFLLSGGAAVGLTLVSRDPSLFPGLTGPHLLSSEAAAVVPSSALRLGAAFAAVALISIVAAWRGTLRPLALAMALLSPLVIVSGSAVASDIARDRSSLPLAQAIGTRIEAGDRLIGVGVVPHSLAYYLGRRIDLSSEDAGPVQSNYISTYANKYRTAGDTALHDADWWKRQLSSCPTRAVFIVAADNDECRDRMSRTLPLIIETRKYAAYGPCEPRLVAERR